MDQRLVSEIELMTYEAQQFLFRHFLENVDDTLTHKLLINLGYDSEKLIALRQQNLKSNKST